MLGLLFLIAAQLERASGGAFLVPVLLAASWPAFTRQARREHDPRLAQLLVLALCLKLFGSLVRYWVAVAFYDSNADAFEYHGVGVDLAMRFRGGEFGTGLASLSGTDFIPFFTGLTYTITGSSIFAGFLLYSWLAFGGMFYLYRAFTIAIPDGNRGATPACCSSCRRCSTGPPASARKPGCCSRSAWPPSAPPGCSPAGPGAGWPWPGRPCGSGRWCARTSPAWSPWPWSSPTLSPGRRAGSGPSARW